MISIINFKQHFIKGHFNNVFLLERKNDISYLEGFLFSRFLIRIFPQLQLCRQHRDFLTWVPSQNTPIKGSDA